jgi:hypothetical protein
MMKTAYFDDNRSIDLFMYKDSDGDNHFKYGLHVELDIEKRCIR